MKNILSIVIPTKNREKYCFNAVESILSLPYKKMQLVVQDNSDVKTLEKLLEKFSDDERLLYNYTPPPFSSVDNCNAALGLATGEYVCLIGDDDGINPEIFEAAKWAEDNNVDALVGNISANYRWEGTGAPNTLFTKMTGGTLTIEEFDGKAIEINIEDSLSKLMENGCTNYLEFPFPKLYHGIVRMKCLDEIKQKTGAYLKGLSPDIYSAITLACNVNKLVAIDYPLSIPGVCGQSTSITEGQLKTHSKKLEDAPHFRDRGPYDWSVQVPRIYCVQTIWADSGFAALREMNRQDLIEKFNKYRLYANIISADKTLKPMIEEHVSAEFEKSKGAAMRKVSVEYAKGPAVKFIKNRAVSRAKIILGLKKLTILNDLPDIETAMHALSKYLNKTKINFLDELSSHKLNNR